MNKTLKWVLIIGGIILGLAAIAFGFIWYEMTHSMVKKPAVYLYPREDMPVDVRLRINGRLTESIPYYDGGWDVLATREGFIDGKYDYLFYEARLNKIELPDSGWVVAYDELGQWFDINLKVLGLNEKEAAQFKEYWLSELPKANYYEIRLLDQGFLSKNMELVVTPEPDTVIRLNFYFRPLRERIELEEPVIDTPKREGFSVVEWGGILG